jgi:hypothetical protein
LRSSVSERRFVHMVHPLAIAVTNLPSGWRHLTLVEPPPAELPTAGPPSDELPAEHLDVDRPTPPRSERSHLRLVLTEDPEQATWFERRAEALLVRHGLTVALGPRDPRLADTIAGAVADAADAALDGHVPPRPDDPYDRLLSRDTSVVTAAPTEAPFGLPILDELPELAHLLTELRAIDDLTHRALDRIRSLAASGEVESTTGLSLSTWLSLVGRRTRSDARMLTSAAAALDRFPALAAACRDNALSWAQTRAITLATRGLPSHLDERADRGIGDAIAGVGNADPDTMLSAIRWALADGTAGQTAAAEAEASRTEYLAMQPRLDGTGGTIHGDLGAHAFATLDAALNLPAAQAPDAEDPQVEADVGSGRGVDARRRVGRLVELCEIALAGGTPGGRARPQLLLRAELSSLLDRAQIPATLLTTLFGGQLQLTAAAARQLLDARGADLRTTVIDEHGAVVGVGRRKRVAPDWLRDAVLAQHDTCSHPGCLRPARMAEIDHATPWHPHRPGDPRGRTDLDELGPCCSHHNRRKEADGWQVHQLADGRRRWTHLRTGVRTTTAPATWRPPPAPPDGELG